MEDFSVCFNQDSFISCSAENKKEICHSLERTLNSFLPLNDSVQTHINLHSLLKCLHFLSMTDNLISDETNIIIIQIARETIVLLETHQNDRESSQILISIFEKTLLLVKEINFSEIATSVFNKAKNTLSEIFRQPWSDDTSVDVSKSILFINLISAILSVVSRRRLKHVIETQDDDMQFLILSLVSCGDPSINALTTMHLLPKLLENDSKLELRRKLWELIASAGGRDNVFMLLCSTIELFLPEQSNNYSFLHQDELWKILHRGVTHKNQVVRKQARYMLKRTLDVVARNKIMIDVKYFIWDQHSSLETWDKFFLVMEILEEKQVHLIKPMLPIIESLFNSLSVHWALCALNQVINHDNNHIVKWGVLFFLQLAPTVDVKTFLVQKLLPVLNSTNLYQSENYENLCDVSIKLNTLFYGIACSQDGEFFRELLNGMCSISWAPLPLYHVTQALGNLPHIPAWGPDDLLVLKKFLIDTIACQSRYLRAAVQSMLLRSMISLTDIRNCDLSIITDILSLFNRLECFRRGLADWKLTINWLKQAISPQTFLSHCLQQNSLSNSAVARILVVFCDAGLVEEDYVNGLMQQVLPKLDGCETRLYISHQQVDNNLDFVVSLLEEINYDSNENNEAVKNVSCAITSMASGVLSYLHSRLVSPLSIHDFHSIQLYTRVLQVMGDIIFRTCNNVQTKELLHTAVTTCQQGTNPSLALQKFLATIVMEWCSACIDKYQKHEGIDELREILQDFVIKATTSETLNLTSSRILRADSTRDLQTLWGRIASGQLRVLWTMFGTLLQHRDSSLHQTLSPTIVLQLAKQGIELGGPEILPPIMKCVKYFLPKIEDTEIVKDFITSCYTLSFEHRKTELFWLSIEQFIALSLNSSILQREDLSNHLVEIVDLLHEQSQLITGLFNLVIQQLCSDFSPRSVVVGHILTLGLLFGPVLRKEQKIRNCTCAYIESLGDDIPANILLKSQRYANVEIRAASICALLGSTVQLALVERVARAILDLELSRANKKSRYFCQSQMHYNKMRAAQILLTLQPLLLEEFCGELLRWSCESLIQECHQPSVRYLLEWLIAKILSARPALEEEFLTIIKEASEKRQGSISSFISALYLWILCCVECHLSELPRITALIVQLILPWTMAQQYNIRLYAQVALLRLWTVSNVEGLEEVTERLRPLHAALQTSLEQGSAVKNALKLQDDFYFSVFHPLKHFSLQSIFCEIPRLSNIDREEWIEYTMFPTPVTGIKLTNPDDLLSKCQLASWITKATRGTETTEEEGITNVVQRKVMPWRNMIAATTGREQLHRNPQLGLIVVASLVDRVPNLGGLSRTCEVLAASELVLHSLRVTEDPLFQSLSVSADKWLRLSEVKLHELPEYLSAMKTKEYTLIAAEQTSNSVPLQEMNFPKKTLLLLGNEKEGIPAELLPLVDVCVEVPQRGMIRSLNVHVTGALFIWQYFTQHQLTAPSVNGTK